MKQLGRIPPASGLSLTSGWRREVRLIPAGGPPSGLDYMERFGIWNDAQRGLKEGLLVTITLAACDVDESQKENGM